MNNEWNQIVWNTRKTTVAMKPIPKVRATCLNTFLSIAIFREYREEEDSISEVMSRIMAFIASHNPISEIDSGNSIVYTSMIL